MNNTDRERLNAAAEKRRRKFARWTETPQAKQRRREMEAEMLAGIPIESFPLPSPEPSALVNDEGR